MKNRKLYVFAIASLIVPVAASSVEAITSQDITLEELGGSHSVITAEPQFEGVQSNSMAQQQYSNPSQPAQVQQQWQQGNVGVGNPEPIYVYPEQQPVVTQPTTVVESSPLVSSRAEQLRQSRQRAEIETEQKIVEKLEASRLEDEQRRLDKIFANEQERQGAKAEPSIGTAPPVIQIISPEKDEYEEWEKEERLKAEIRESVKADLDSAKKSEDVGKTNYYVGVLGGTVNYPDTWNVESDFAAGAMIGWVLPNNVGVEMGFQHSTHLIDQSHFVFREVTQQNWALAAKYHVFRDSMISPNLGALASYTRREYENMYAWGSNAFPNQGQNLRSDALDMGIALGVDFKVASNLTLGFDWRYLTNIDNRYSNSKFLNRSIYRDINRDLSRPMEEQDYQFYNFSLKVVF